MSFRRSKYGRAHDARGSEEDEKEFDEFIRDSRRKRQDRKTAQLCRQVHRTLMLAWGTLAEEAILELSVIDVKPAPDASTLAVALQKPRGTTVSDVEIHAALDRVQGRLRAAVAASVCRKRAPMLTFYVFGQEDVGP